MFRIITAENAAAACALGKLLPIEETRGWIERDSNGLDLIIINFNKCATASAIPKLSQRGRIHFLFLSSQRNREVIRNKTTNHVPP